MPGHKDKSPKVVIICHNLSIFSKVVKIVLWPLSSRSALDHPNPYWMSESQVGSAFNQQEWTSHKWMIKHGIGAEILRESSRFQLPETGKLLNRVSQKTFFFNFASLGHMAIGPYATNMLTRWL